MSSNQGSILLENFKTLHLLLRLVLLVVFQGPEVKNRDRVGLLDRVAEGGGFRERREDQVRGGSP